MAVICVGPATLKLAAMPLKRTAVAPLKPLPVRVTRAPTGPDAGVKLATAGGKTTVKLAVLVAMPPGVVTVICPPVASFGTVAVICAELTTLKGAATPPTVTAVAPAKPAPVMVTIVPTGPAAGARRVIPGAGTTVKLATLAAVPPGVVTVTGPLVAPAGTVAVICVGPTTANVAASAPLKATFVAPMKPLPVRVTLAPAAPRSGVKYVRVGVGMTTKLVALLAVPPAVVTVIGPLVAPVGTVAVICVDESTLKVAVAPLKRTALALSKALPVSVTVAPTGPVAGAKRERPGGGITLNPVTLVAVPPGVVTEIVPLVAPAGAVVVIEVGLTTVKAAAVPLKETALTPMKPVPVSVTLVPTGPAVGAKAEIVGMGLGVTVKLSTLVAVPPGVVTETVPVVAPAGTTAVISVAEVTLKLAAAVPWKATAVAPLRPLPVSVTLVPTGPEAGVNPVSVGAGMTAAVVYALRQTLALPIWVVRSVQLEPVELT